MLPILAAVATPLVKSLLENGLTTLAGAIQAKGKSYVEEKIGVKLPDENAPATAAQLMELRKLEFEHEERLGELAVRQAELELEGERVAQGAVSARWQADMLSDSWLSKNIRPMVLIALLTAYALFSVASAFGLHVTQAYVELLGQMLMMVITAYFAGRTVEKIVDMKERGK